MADVDYERALRYPAQGDDALGILAAGTVPMVVLGTLYLFAVLGGMIVPGLQLLALALALPAGLVVFGGWMGYWVRVARSSFRGETEPPGIDDPWKLARDGAWASVIHLAYMLPAILIGLVGVGVGLALVLVPGILGGSDVAVAGIWTAFLFAMLAFVLLPFVGLAYVAVVWYVMPISLCRFAHVGEVREVLSFSAIRRVGGDGDYALSWGVFALMAFGPVVLALFSSFAFVGYFLIPLLPVPMFYVGTAAIHVLGRQYASEMELGRDAPEKGSFVDTDWDRLDGESPGATGE